MTAPSLTWGVFGRGAHEARPEEPVVVPQQARPDEPVPRTAADEAPAVPTAVQPAPERPVAGPAERALREASRELAALHPLDRLEQLDEDVPPAPLAGAVQAVGAVHAVEAVPADEAAAEVPWALPPVLDVLPSGASRSRSLRDLLLPVVLLTELFAGVWLGAAKPWQGETADPLQARYSSTAPASEDLRLPEPAGTVPLPATSFVLPSSSPSASPSRDAGRQVDPFQPR